MERRSLLEVRAEGSSLAGYAAVFGQTADLGHTTESIRAGAFTNSLSKNDVLGLLDHDPSKLLGRTRSGSLSLREDHHGLAFTLSLPNTTVGHDVLALASRGDLGGCSVGFFITKDHWQGSHRILEQVDLREISIISSWPAYAGTSVKPRGRRLALARRWMETL